MSEPLPMPDAGRLSEEQKKTLESFNRGFDLDLTRLPDAEERFFLSEFLRSKMVVLLNEANLPAREAATLLQTEPPRNREAAMKSLHQFTDLREKSREVEVAFECAKNILKSVGFEVDAWMLRLDPFPTIKGLSRKPADPTPPTP